MRFPALAFLVALAACGGATAAQNPEAKAPEGTIEEDHSFSEYAATHGITTLSGSSSETAEATADGLRFEHVEKDRPVKLDGVLSEWPPFAKAPAAGSAPAKTSLSIALQYDEAKIYVGADISDPSFVAGQHRVVLTLAIPQAGGSYAAYEIDLYPGKPGESEGSVRVGRRPAPGAKIVEAPSGAGMSLEASLPWSALPEARSTRVGIHGVARYVGSGGTIATGPGDARHPAAMPWVPTEPELSLIEQLLDPKGLTRTAPAAEVIADITGDGVRERIAVYEHYLTICGTSFLGGTGFFYRDLVGELVKLEVRDVTGRGKEDVVVRRRASVGDGTREYLEILSTADASQEPRITFAHEIEVRQSDHRVDNSVRIGRGAIDVAVERATNWDPASYNEPIASDVEPVLLPWGPVRSQTYRWDGSRFARSKETFQKEQLPPGAVAHAAGSGGGEDPAAPPRPAEPPTPTVTRGGDLSAQLLDTYRRDRGLPPDAKPRVDLQVQVSGDERPERVLLIGRDIVVFGPGFKGGTGYAFVTLSQFEAGGDVKDLTARDLTGDGDADLVVRGVRRVKADHGAVESEVIFVYQVDDGGTISRLFGIESGREQGKKRVQGLVQFIPSPGGKSFDIVAAPGRAFGWTARSYPWAQDPPGGGDIEPLLLPWGGIKSVRYAWNGSQFARAGD
ncbi:MAG: hypothetical protein FWD17_06950 [Polyangiaceae bacterium]|nr:hypothetical protein [Polyangiaceae bacterium]